ncbi:TPR repeat-containing protein [Tolypothrix sp. NIES-4075]|uniref:CHAT domain-containing protein n=1 Tax=Tolypothrix sp. NIES-4075 TaxID=2005459 RepID=UPI000B5C3198|nr:tetratricopeptide repeat protein [Tolypothrix sp. NIES-4075]GAX40949.1 TPR repeat-containing protein [Tolypothrix sp. NIES-4075]
MHRQSHRLTLIVLLTAVLMPFSAKLTAPFQVSQVLAQTTDARKVEADRLFQQGIQQFQISQFEAALKSWQQALIIYREIKDRQSEGKALGNLGIAYGSLGNHAKEIEYEQQWLAIAREIKDRQSEGKALGNLGIAYNDLGNYAKAIEYLQQRLAIAREMKDPQGEGKALDNLGNAYYSLGNYAKAVEYLQQRLVIVREIKDRESEGAALGNLGNAYRHLGNYAKAIEYLEQVLAIAREMKDRQSEGKALGNLDAAYISLGNYGKAIEYAQQWLVISREIKDRQGEGKALVNLGISYISLGDYAKAIEYEQQWLAIAREIKDRQGEGKALGILGVAYNELGNYAKAIEYEQQWLAIAREIKDRESEGKALGNLGISYISLGDYAKAIEYQQQWLAIAREIKDRESEGKALGNLGSNYYFLGNYAKAIEYSQQGLAIAREIKDRQSEGKALGNLGSGYYLLGKYGKAIEYAQQWLVIAREINDHLSEGLALNNLGSALFKSGKLSLAESTLIEGIKVRESLRRGLDDINKVSISDTQRSTYQILQEVLIAENKTDTALEIAERGRARAFVELLNKRVSANNSVVDKQLDPSIAQIKQTAKAQNATLVQYSIIYDDFKVEGKEQSKESELYIWVVKPTGEVTFRKADLKPLWQKENTTLDDFVTISRKSIGARGRGGVDVSYNPAVQTQNRFQQLHNLLIKPIADLLPTNPNQRVIFIPQRSLFLVPFPALQDTNGKYLIEKHTILTAPAIQVLDLTHKRRVETRNFASNALIVGNPTMPSVAFVPGDKPQQLPSLPGAEIEAKAIATIFHTKAIIGNQATKTAIVQKMTQARIVHLATHGLLDDYKQMGVPGAIALAPDPQKTNEEGNGLLTAYEILDLKLNAELVVLSACDTGRGRITGDGVIGLSRSLITAGVPSVMVSLWKVPDEPTASLMSEFYKNIQHNTDKATALRQAMLTTMKQNPQPLDWAAFTLIGESE